MGKISFLLPFVRPRGECGIRGHGMDYPHIFANIKAKNTLKSGISHILVMLYKGEDICLLTLSICRLSVGPLTQYGILNRQA